MSGSEAGAGAPAQPVPETSPGRGTLAPVGAGPAALLAALIAALAGCAAWPIYRTPQVWLLVAAAAGVACALVWAGQRWRWGFGTTGALLLALVVLVVPLAVPDALGGGGTGILRGLGDGLAAIALGWKHVLTLTLPLGTYQAVLVPLLVTVMGAVGASTWLALGRARTAPWAALPALAAVVYGTLLGPVELSPALVLGPLTIAAPRELLLWIATALLVTGWIAWTSGAPRRAALRLGRGARARRRGAARGALGAGIVLAALTAGAVLAPAVAAPPRAVPRERVDPVVVVREQSSPLAGYRVWKRDAAFTAPLFSVTSAAHESGTARASRLPSRLRLAVLDRSDGVDFTATARDGSFTRFPSGTPVTAPTRVSVEILPGYSGIWVPLTAELGAPPAFSGPRAAELTDTFYLDRDTGAGIAVPTTDGLRRGDSYTAELSAAPDAELDAAPAHTTPEFDGSELPQLDRWLRAQRIPATGTGLTTAIERLRERGYLSHALSAETDRAWLDALAAEHGTRFVASAGGHSVARVEELFAQLNDQQESAGPGAEDAALVAAVGDDEQFAAASVYVARALGFDARVVLGVRLNGAGVPGVPACADTCTGENLAAWIEARGADGVWAPLDVTPQVTTPPSALDTGERLPEHATVPEERDAPTREPEFGAGLGEATPPQTARDVPSASLWSTLRWGALGGAALLLIALAALFLPAVKRLRTRRRRTAPSAETRILGAWEELIDAHTDAGTPALRRVIAGTPAAALSRAELGAALPGGAALAAAVDQAVFAPQPPEHEAATAIWVDVDAEIARLRSAAPWWQRLRARYRIASLGAGTRRGRDS